MSYLVYECMLYNEDSSVDSWGVKTGRLLKTEVVDINSNGLKRKSQKESICHFHNDSLILVTKTLFHKSPVNDKSVLIGSKKLTRTNDGQYPWRLTVSPDHNELTHWGRDEMYNISQTTFSNAFSSMKMLEFRLKIHWSLFPRVQLTISQHWFR